MAHIEYDLGELELWKDIDPYMNKLYNEKKAYLEGKTKLPKPKRQSKLKQKTLKGKESTVMKAISKAHLKGDKAVISTDMNVRAGLSPKDKKALKASIMKALDIHIKGGMINENNKVMPKPLIKDEARQEEIEEAFDDFEEITNYNPMNLIMDDWDKMKKPADIVERYINLKGFLDMIDYDNPLHNEKDYKSKTIKNADNILRIWREKKNEIYEFLNMMEGTGLYA